MLLVLRAIAMKFPTQEALRNERTTVTELSRLLQKEADKLALMQAESSV